MSVNLREKKKKNKSAVIILFRRHNRSCLSTLITSSCYDYQWSRSGHTGNCLCSLTFCCTLLQAECLPFSFPPISYNNGSQTFLLAPYTLFFTKCQNVTPSPFPKMVWLKRFIPKNIHTIFQQSVCQSVGPISRPFTPGKIKDLRTSLIYLSRLKMTFGRVFSSLHC